MQTTPTYPSRDTISGFGILSEQWPHPYRFRFDGVATERLEDFLAARLSSLMHDPNTCSRILEDEGRAAGIACWRPLPWDSGLFGFPACRIEVLASSGDYWVARTRKADIICRVLDECRQRGFRHLTARLNAGDSSGIHCLEAAGFELIDGIQTFSLSLSNRMSCGEGEEFRIRAFEPADLEQILSIARSAYVFDRFHSDSALGLPVADRVNEEWLRSSCLGDAADAVIVATKGTTVLGYVTCKVDQGTHEALGARIGTIVMVATEGRARRSGVAKAATAGALNWFQEHSIDIVEVGTQLRNVPAARLYERCGFRLVGVNLTFRKVL